MYGCILSFSSVLNSSKRLHLKRTSTCLKKRPEWLSANWVFLFVLYLTIFCRKQYAIGYCFMTYSARTHTGACLCSWGCVRVCFLACVHAWISTCICEWPHEHTLNPVHAIDVKSRVCFRGGLHPGTLGLAERSSHDRKWRHEFTQQLHPLPAFLATSVEVACPGLCPPDLWNVPCLVQLQWVVWLVLRILIHAKGMIKKV